MSISLKAAKPKKPAPKKKLKQAFKEEKKAPKPRAKKPVSRALKRTFDFGKRD